jgi:hypothetical protein
MDKSGNGEVFVEKMLLALLDGEDVAILITKIKAFGLEDYCFNFLS